MADLRTLMDAHTAALAAWDALAGEEWDERSTAANKVLTTTGDAMLDHRPTSLAEVATKAAFMACTKTFCDWDDVGRIRLIQALMPAAGGAA